MPDTPRIRTLSESSLLRYITFAALYVAQGIPEGVLIFALPAWLAKHGVSPAQIGTFIGISVLPWSFKLINAPLMDRFTYLPMGRRRPWVLIGQAGILTSFFMMSFITNPVDDLFILTAMGFVVMFFASFQDVAVDGMAIDILPVDQQARANGLMWGSKTAGIAGSVALGSLLINAYGFSLTVMLFSAVVLLIMLIPLILKEHPGEKVMPWTHGQASPVALNMQLHDWGSIFKNLIRVFFLPMSLILGVGVFFNSINRGLIDAVLPVLTVQELGWLDTEYSNIFATAGLVSGAIGMFIGGALIDFLGKIRMMAVFLFLIMLLLSIMSFFYDSWGSVAIVTGYIIAFYTLFTLLTISIFATAMQLCWKKVAATQFTIYMAVSNLGLSVGASLLGPLKSMFSYHILILTGVFSSGVLLFLLRFIRLDQHMSDLVDLEKNGVVNVKKIIQNLLSAFRKRS
jgi:PAT family beta-lactamase induction signal transducer AmpG